MKLTIKIPLLMGIVVLVSALAIIIAVDKYVHESMEKTILSGLSSEVHSNADFLDAKLQGQLDVLWEVANRARTRSMNWQVVQPNLLPDLPRLNAIDLSLVTLNGTSNYVKGDDSLNIKDRNYFKRAAAGEKNVDIVVSRISGNIEALFAVPILQNDNRDGAVIGVLTARKDGSKTLSNLVAEIWTSHKSSYAFLIDGEGTIIGHRNQDLVTKQFNPIKAATDWSDSTAKSLSEALKVALQQKNGIAEYSFNGKNIVSAYIAIPGNSWKLFLAMEKEEIREELSQITSNIAIIGAFFLVVGIIVAIIVGRLIANPIIRILAALKDINHGEGDLTQSISVQSKDEIGDLAINFNKLMETIRLPISETKTAINDLAIVSEELSKISKELNEASEETVNHASNATDQTGQMSTNVNIMASGAEEASVSANKVAGAAEEMSASMSAITAAIEQMSASINEIASKTADVHNVATSATAKAIKATSVIGKLGNSAKEIGHVTNIIKKIADKTNLLALNATIEAASAGEAGKGFAVVAGEIKELATQSASSAEDIARRIESIQIETNDAVLVISEVSEVIGGINNSVEEITAHVDQQTKANNEISSNVVSVNTGAQMVASSIGTVAKGVNDVSKNAVDSASRVKQLAEKIVTMSDEANKSNQNAFKLKTSAGELIAMANDLRTVMGKFKV